MTKYYIIGVKWLLNKGVKVPEILMYLFDKAAWKSKTNLDLAIFGLKPEVLQELAKKKLIWVFRNSLDTPALVKFYKENKLDLKLIQSNQDFYNLVPETTKSNYINAFTLEERCRGGELPRQGIIFKSAGVAGERTYWTQSLKEEDRFSVFVPFGLEYLYGYSKKNYHLLNCWAFGTWPTAIDFTKAARECGRMINIGPNIEETIETLKKLGEKHRYLISGYPPYLRTLLYRGIEMGLKWERYKIDFLTGGEGFVEEWRDLIRNRIGNNTLIYSAYGSTDKGLGEGIETPITITIRNLIRIYQISLFDKKRAQEMSIKIFCQNIDVSNDKDIRELFKNIFDKEITSEFRTPMIFQSDPLTYMQEDKIINIPGGKIHEVITTNLKTYASQPVIRYNINDESGTVGFNKMMNEFNKIGINIYELVNKIPHNDNRLFPYPFFYVFGRSTGMVSLDGANIFPEEVGRMIEYLPLGEKINSFRIGISDDYKLVIELELKNGLKDQIEIKQIEEIKTELCKYSPGFSVIAAEKLPSSELQVQIYKFGQGPFHISPSINPHIIKYQYVGSKIFGRH